MLTENQEIIIEFMEECRNQSMIKDELFITQERLYDTLYQLEDMLKQFPTAQNTYIQLESLISDTLSLTRKTYFEYGNNCSEVEDRALFRKYNKEAA